MILVGVAPISDMGDFLQYYCAAKILKGHQNKYLYVRVGGEDIPYSELNELMIEGFFVYCFTYHYNILSKSMSSIALSRRLKLSKHLRSSMWYLLDGIHQSFDRPGVNTYDLVVFGGHTYNIFDPLYGDFYRLFRHSAGRMIALPMVI